LEIKRPWKHHSRSRAGSISTGEDQTGWRVQDQAGMKGKPGASVSPPGTKEARQFLQNQQRRALVACTPTDGPQEPALLQWDGTLKRSMPVARPITEVQRD